MGFHGLDMILVFVVALLIFGPKKLPEIGSQMGRTLNAFRKGMRDIRNPLDDSLDLETFTAQHRELKALEARRLELEILERELAVKRAEAALQRNPEAEILAYTSETIVEADDDREDYVESEKNVDADSVSPEEITYTSAEPVEVVQSNTFATKAQPDEG